MHLNRLDIKRIANLLEKFPQVETFEINADASSGIGRSLTITFDQEIAGYSGSFTVEISGIEDW